MAFHVELSHLIAVNGCQSNTSVLLLRESMRLTPSQASSYQIVNGAFGVCGRWQSQREEQEKTAQPALKKSIAQACECGVPAS